MPTQPPTRRTQPLGIQVKDARRLLLRLPNVSEGGSYGKPSFLLNGHFLARFRDHDTVLVPNVGTIGERDVLMQLDPHAFFFTDHYRDHPAVLIRLAEVPRLALRGSGDGVVAPPSRDTTGAAPAAT